jgi:hypothetical protein
MEANDFDDDAEPMKKGRGKRKRGKKARFAIVKRADDVKL